MERSTLRRRLAAGTLTVLLLATALAGISGSHGGSAPAHASAPVGPWDPLLGSPTLGVPRYHVASTHLATAMPSSIGSTVGPDWVSGTPVWLAYDASDQSLWVAALPSSVDVIPANAIANLTAVVPVGSQPFGVAVDPAYHEVFVTNSGSDNVSVLSDTTDLPVGSVGVGSQPMGIAYDAALGEMFVANEGSNNVTVISDATLSVVATIAVGVSPIGVAMDPISGDVFVADHDSYQVTVIAAATDQVVATVPAGMGPYGVAVDNATDNVYVTNELSSNVSVVNAGTDTIMANIPVIVPYGADLQGIAYNSGTGQVWVGGGSNYLVLLDTIAEDVAFVYSTDPAGVAYDPDTGAMCVTNTFNATFQCLTPASPQTNTISVTFSETGLPPGTPWNVSAPDGPGLTSSSPQIVFQLCPKVMCFFPALFNGTTPYSFVIGSSAGYIPAFNQTTAYVASSPILISVAFAPGAGEYPVRFDASGLPPNIGWSVDLSGLIQSSSGTSLTFYEPNGSYAFTPGGAAGYAVSPPFGNLNVQGSAIRQNLTFSFFTWGVYFAESGLPAGTPWYVNFTSGPTGFPLPAPARIVGTGQIFALANGSYSYTVQTSAPGYLAPPPGTLWVHGGGSASVTFLPVDYAVTFTENGLNAGTNWSVNLSGDLRASSTPTISFSEPNGVYSFTVVAINGYHPTPSAGSVIVAGADPTPIPISFSSTWIYRVIFHESGLPVGTGWSVAIGSQFASSLTDDVELDEPNGTYGYVVQAVPGFTTTYSGILTVAGTSQIVPIVFLPQTFPVIVAEFGLPSGTNWSVTVSNVSLGISETHATNGSAIIFYLPNGTFVVSVQVPPGYSVIVSMPIFTVAGTTSGAPTVQFYPTANPGGGEVPTNSVVPVYLWWLLGALGAGLVVLGAIALLLYRRPPTPPVAGPPR